MKPRRLKKERRGATTVEFALTLPLVLLFFFSSIELARVNMIRNSAKNAAYLAARRSIIPGGTATEAEQTAIDTLNATGVGHASISVSPSVVTAATKQIKVTVAVPINENSWVIPRIFSSVTVTNSCTLTRESSQSGF